MITRLRTGNCSSRFTDHQTGNVDPRVALCRDKCGDNSQEGWVVSRVGDAADNRDGLKPSALDLALVLPYSRWSYTLVGDPAHNG